MVGGPSQMDLYDYKPQMGEWYDKDLPDSIRMGQRLTTMTSGQKRFPIAPSKYKFAQHGQSGMWVSELLPHTAKMVDDMCFIRSMHTEAINHEPAITYMQTGNMVTGRPCLGSWASYGLGRRTRTCRRSSCWSPSRRTPSRSRRSRRGSGRPATCRASTPGVSFRTAGDPILYINNPPGVPADVRRNTLDGLKALNEMNYQTRRRPRDAHAHPAVRTGLPHAGQRARPDRHRERAGIDLSSSTARTPRSPAPSPTRPCWPAGWSSAGVRFVQIYHNNWDTHVNVAGRLPDQCKDVDQACWGLIQDLKSRGLLDETLVIWGGEFGRTIYSQGGLSHENYGRDHHPRCFTMWMAGGGSRPGTIYGETDDFSYNIVKDPVHIRDFHATVLHLLGFDHERFTYRYQGLDQKLTGVEPARVIKELLA